MCCLVLVSSLLTQSIANAQLTVNVKNKGGEVVRQSIISNTTQDTIHLEFTKTDGTLITQFVDFANEIQIFRAIIQGEEERGFTGHQVMCFVTRFIRHEFISSDAMSKLRQKNPGAIRHPEEDKGVETVQTDLLVDLNEASLFSPYVLSLCSGAKESTYTRDSDLKLLAHTLGKDYTQLLSATSRRSGNTLQRCNDVAEIWRPCLCHYQTCIGWFPCGLKYCKGKDSTGKVVSYRCGIKTCSKCREFEYYVSRKQLCLWDEPVWGVTQAAPQQDSMHDANNMDDNNNDDEDSKVNGVVEETADKISDDANILKK
ncbi:hypothetical protein CAPTEDRAFT_184708 [Capitella teleta]|uniref:Out at first protein n=1 Tax=Capitella teleta TaxID=283909 RepID=R7VJK8_CAPTE|nr:hypothetical protein CAPTEDRAFT_184708 [Capitella teleta]|eukprot:ELU18787.1 hypothetical protein CAPTEDRAFT_184708 [Capitella teleta]